MQSPLFSRVLTVTASALTLAVPAAYANYESGRLGLMAEEAFKATRVTVPYAVLAPSFVVVADFQAGGVLPIKTVPTAISAFVPAESAPVLATATVPAGETRFALAPAGPIVPLASSIVSVPPTLTMFFTMAPKGPSRPIPASVGNAAGLSPFPVSISPMVALALNLVPNGPSRSIPAPIGNSSRPALSPISITPSAALSVAMMPNGPLRVIREPAGLAGRLVPSASSSRYALSGFPAISIPQNFSALAAARLVRDALADGSLNPRNPAWRPYLALLLSGTNGIDAEALFAVFLNGCAGHDDRAKLATAEAWAEKFENGRFSATLTYCAARYAFVSGDYPASLVRCERIIADHPEIADRAMLLLALAQAQSGDLSRSLLTLQSFRKLYPKSIAAPEARFMEAWIALQELRNEEAIAIFHEIVTEDPKAPAAVKANRMLASLEAK